ncbi:unnamed protein product [Cunninghamella blakesleeana]
MMSIATSSKILVRANTLSKSTIARAYLTTSTQRIAREQDNHLQFKDQAHHQVAPLSSNTLYTPNQSNSSNVFDDASSTFSPVVNHVFDE